MRVPLVVVVADRGDAVATRTRGYLRALGAATCRLLPEKLAQARVCLVSEECLLEGQPVTGILWRVLPGAMLSDGYAAGERPFCDAETAATWLAALNLPSVVAVNRYSAEAWYGSLVWPVWRRVLIQAGVAVSPLILGDVASERPLRWLPYGGGAAHPPPPETAVRAMGAALWAEDPGWAGLILGGKANHPAPPENLREAARALWKSGVYLARIALDQCSRVVVVDTLPALSDGRDMRRVASALARHFHATRNTG